MDSTPVSSPSRAHSSLDLPTDSSTPVSAAKYSKPRRYGLLVVFCLAQFLDSFNNSALFSAIPSLIIDLDVPESETTWIFSAFQLTFASFLLLSGRISDIYNPKYTFICGVSALGILSIGAGFVKSRIPLIVIRALSGIAASLTIPSALNLLVNIFPEPAEQARTIGIFGGSGAVGNSSLFVQYANWSWVFWFVAIVALPISAVCIFLIPPRAKIEETRDPRTAKWKSLDISGVSILTIAVILFIFSVTSGSSSGWATARVLAPLIISIVLTGGFFYYETKIPASRAAVPPSTWFLPNFAVLVGMALMPFFWWTTIYTVFMTLWQNVYHWSAIITTLHMIPLGIVGFAASFTGPVSRVISPKWVLLFAQGLLAISSILLHFADAPNRYFPFALPGFIIGTAGCMLTYAHTNIAIFRATPSAMAGTVGAIFNGALQLGSAVGLAIVTSIQTNVEANHGGPTSYSGRAAVFWFVLATVCVEAVSLLVFYDVKVDNKVVNDESGVHPDQGNQRQRDGDEKQRTTEPESS
ncbi:hypothetical protein NLI96_g10372 [Meripilus lineatus]|uniref:Major facilitator superfamily (MFS) profile domain-containing protein n=1 Tax=Meripilus lineatus TaxID=2056292 RepID=A0AAD5Y9D2_9APHY|nr:hypothetical protein NLI96_g10372 [Physisporinus lineatus]